MSRGWCCAAFVLVTFLGSERAVAQAVAACSVEWLDVQNFESAVRVELATIDPPEREQVQLLAVDACESDRAQVIVQWRDGRSEGREIGLDDVTTAVRGRLLAIALVELLRLGPATILAPEVVETSAETMPAPIAVTSLIGALRLELGQLSAPHSLFVPEPNDEPEPAARSGIGWTAAAGTGVQYFPLTDTPLLISRLRFGISRAFLEGRFLWGNEGQIGGSVRLVSLLGGAGVNLFSVRRGIGFFSGDVNVGMGRAHARGRADPAFMSDPFPPPFASSATRFAVYANARLEAGVWLGPIALALDLEAGWLRGVVVRDDHSGLIAGIDGPSLQTLVGISISGQRL